MRQSKIFALVIVTAASLACGNTRLKSGTVVKSDHDEFQYVTDDNDIFSAKSSVNWNNTWQGKHCDSVYLTMSYNYVEKIEGTNCK